MTDIYNRNRDAFQRRYGIAIPQFNSEDGPYFLDTAKDGDAVLSVAISSNGERLRLNSLYSPTYEAISWVKGRDIPVRRTTAMVCGLSTGVFLREMLNTYREDTTFFLYEPREELFYFLCSHIDISDLILNSRVYMFITNEQKNQMVDLVYNDILLGRSEVVGVTTPFYAEDSKFKGTCDQIGKLSVSIRNFKMQRGRDALRCRIYAWNHMEGCHFLSDIASFFSDDIPAIIVSAGPSLEKNASKLNGYKNHAFILATDRSLSTLKKYGVVPDAVISVDAIKNPDYLEYAFEQGLPIICSYQLNIETQKKAHGNLFFFDAISYEKKLFGKKAQLGSGLDMGGNVAGGAFMVLKSLGVKDIIIVGQDLAYSQGRHHADDIEDGMPDEDELFEVEGVEKNTVTTNKMWVSYRDFFVRQLRQNPEIRLIDATEGGAYIEGSMVMTLDKVREMIPYREFSFQEYIGNLSDKGFDHETKISAGSKEIINGWLLELSTISGIAKELRSVCDDLISMYKSDKEIGEGNPEIKHLNELRKRLHSMEMNSLLEEFWVEDMYSIPPRVLVMTTRNMAIQVLLDAKNYYGKLDVEATTLQEAILEDG